MAAAIRKWKADDLEQVSEDNMFVLSVCRSLPEALQLPLMKAVCDEPLIKIEKIGESEPKPFRPALTPLQGIRVLGMAHVIAGAGCMRALALHGADTMNIWRPYKGTEFDILYNTADVGVRSATLDISEKIARGRFDSLLSDADAFVANRRPVFIESNGLTAEEMAAKRPGIIHCNIGFLHHNPKGPHYMRSGFDFNTGADLCVWNLEGGDDHPAAGQGNPVMNDFITGWLATAAILMALRRRAREGGQLQGVHRTGPCHNMDDVARHVRP